MDNCKECGKAEVQCLDGVLYEGDLCGDCLPTLVFRGVGKRLHRVALTENEEFALNSATQAWIDTPPEEQEREMQS